jgi:aldehyde:ferredoxin oxidoreductase
LNEDLKSLIHLNYLCNDLGLDSMSTGVAIAFAVEVFQRGILKEADGLDLTWGNVRSIEAMIVKIARREGIGTLFADGVAVAAQRLGKEAEGFSLHAKGLEVSLSSPTPTVSLALSWATSNRGACHLEGFSHQVEGGVPFPEAGYPSGLAGLGTSGEGKGRMTALMQNYMAVFNALGLCKFLYFARLPHQTMCQWLMGVTGWELQSSDLMELGDRIYNLKRAYNVRMGISSKDDVLTERIYGLLRPGKPTEEGKRLFFHMRKEYYEARQWDEHGIPKEEKLISLGLKEAARKIGPG